MSLRGHAWSWCLMGLLSGALSSACAGSALSSRTEDEARTLVPVPICVQRLPRRAQPGSIVSLDAKEYWLLLLPAFDDRASTLDLAMLDCSGRPTLARADGTPSKRAVNPLEVVLGSGPDGFKVAWLPLAGTAASRTGLLALLRQRQESLEVYATGVHAGSLGTRLSLERMGPALVVTALEEQCRGPEGARRCDSFCTVYLMSHGRLDARATFPVDHSVDASTAAAAGGAEYRFSASAEYRADGIALSEKLSISEKGRGVVRAVDLERSLRLEGGRLVPSAESLWVQTVRQLGLPDTH